MTGTLTAGRSLLQASGPRNQVLSFYTMPEYEAWKESLGGSTKGWTIKYYKVTGPSATVGGLLFFGF